MGLQCRILGLGFRAFGFRVQGQRLGPAMLLDLPCTPDPGLYAWGYGLARRILKRLQRWVMKIQYDTSTHRSPWCDVLRRPAATVPLALWHQEAITSEQDSSSGSTSPR